MSKQSAFSFAMKAAKSMKLFYIRNFIAKPYMMSNPFSSFHKDVITIFKKNGEILAENINARVEQGVIRTYKTDLILNAGDYVERSLPNGIKEHYIITETHFKYAGTIAPAYFDLTVLKVTEQNLTNMKNPFEQFQTDTIRVISKETGNVSPDLKAHVTPDKINTYDLTTDIAEGDTVERDLPNNRKETYLVLEANYHDKFMTIPAHYVLNVRKTTALSQPKPTHTVYNLHGNNSRVYNHSEDHSSNIVNEASENVFEVLAQLISDKIPDSADLLNILQEMERLKGQTAYTAKYSTFIAKAANHMTILAPFIPALTALLPGH